MQELFLCEFKAPPPLQACFQLHLVSPCCLHAQVDAGRIFVAPKVEVGYLEQTAVSGSERTVWEEARSRMTALIAAEMAMEFAAAEAEKGECRCLLQPAGPWNCQGSGNSAAEKRSVIQVKDSPLGVCAWEFNVFAVQTLVGSPSGLVSTQQRATGSHCCFQSSKVLLYAVSDVSTLLVQ